jgi:hypothetical protein
LCHTPCTCSTLERLSTVPQGSAHSRMPSMASMDLTASYREAGRHCTHPATKRALLACSSLGHSAWPAYGNPVGK